VLRRATALAAFIALRGGLLRSLERAEPFGEYRAGAFEASLGIVMWRLLLGTGVWHLSEPFQRTEMTERFRFL